MNTDHEPKLADRQDFQRKAIRSDLWVCCVNCDHWGPNQRPERPAGCTKWNTYPPADVILVGCPDWLALIPF